MNPIGRTLDTQMGVATEPGLSRIGASPELGRTRMGMTSVKDWKSERGRAVPSSLLLSFACVVLVACATSSVKAVKDDAQPELVIAVRDGQYKFAVGSFEEAPSIGGAQAGCVSAPYRCELEQYVGKPIPIEESFILDWKYMGWSAVEPRVFTPVVQVDSNLASASVKDGRIWLCALDSDWGFSRDSVLRSHREALQRSLGLMVSDPVIVGDCMESLRGDLPTREVTVNLSVSFPPSAVESKKMSISANGSRRASTISEVELTSSERPRSELCRVSMFRSPGLPDTDTLIGNVLSSRLAELLDRLAGQSIEGRALLPDEDGLREDVGVLISGVVRPAFRSAAWLYCEARMEDFMASQGARIVARIRPALASAFVQRRVRLLDLASRTPIVGADVRVRIQSSAIDGLIRSEFVPESQGTVREFLAQSFAWCREEQETTSDSSGFFTIVAPKNAGIVLGATSGEYHFLRHEFDNLELSPRGEDASLFLPSDAIGLFTTRKDSPRKQQIVQ